MATKHQTRTAHTIIHSCATASAVWAAMFSAVPGVSTVALVLGADTPVLTAITVGMIIALGKLFGHSYTKGAVYAAVGQLFGLVFGVSLARALASLIPGGGSLINAGVTFSLTEIIGWAAFSIFDEGKDITKLSKSELKSFVAKGKSRQENSQEFKKTVEKLPSSVKAKYERLTKQLADEDTSDDERQAILKQIDGLLKPYV